MNIELDCSKLFVSIKQSFVGDFVLRFELEPVLFFLSLSTNKNEKQIL